MTDLAILFTLVGSILAWYLVGLILVTLCGIPQWYLGNNDLTIDHEALTFAWLGPLLLIAAVALGAVLLVGFLLDRYPKIKSFRLPRLPAQIVILRRRIKRAAEVPPSQ